MSARMIPKSLRATLLVLPVVGLMACGGGGAEGGGASELGSSSSASGSERASGGGGKGKKAAAVSVKTQAAYGDAVKAFKSYEPKKWNDKACDEVAAKFETVGK